MTDFQRIQLYYTKGWAKQHQVAQYMGYGIITPEQYETITKDGYTS